MFVKYYILIVFKIGNARFEQIHYRLLQIMLTKSVYVYVDQKYS